MPAARSVREMDLASKLRRRAAREDETMKPLTLLVLAGAVGSSVALALYAILWRANVAVRKMATRAA